MVSSACYPRQHQAHRVSELTGRRTMRSRTPIAWLLVLLGAALALPGPHAEEGARSEEGGREEVWMVSFDGALGPATGDLIVRSIANAQAAGARAIIIQMDTPGGLDKAMRDVVKAILSADIVVITYVHPDGARAASAGTYIAYASHIAAMSPATNIGSSTPVSIAPTPSLPSPGEGDEKEAKPPPQDAMMKKVINDAVAYLQGLAELRGRNIDWAEETVREGANLRASVALEKNIIDLIAKDVPTLLAEIDGREIELPTRTVTLDVANARVVMVETDWRHELLEVITDPSIAYGLLIFGVYGLILEFYNPGMIFPAVVGVICLLLGAYGLQMLPVNYAGLALIVVAKPAATPSAWVSQPMSYLSVRPGRSTEPTGVRACPARIPRASGAVHRSALGPNREADPPVPAPADRDAARIRAPRGPQSWPPVRSDGQRANDPERAPVSAGQGQSVAPF